MIHAWLKPVQGYQQGSTDDKGKRPSARTNAQAIVPSSTIFKLAEQFIRRSDSLKDPIQLDVFTRTARFEQVKVLLNNGAEPNILIYGHTIHEHLVHGLIWKDDNVYFLPNSQATLPERISKRTYSHELLRDCRRYRTTPLVESILSGDEAVTILLVQHGAQVDLLTTHLYVCGFAVPSKSDWDSRVSESAKLHRFPIVRRGNYVESFSTTTDDSLRAWLLTYLEETVVMQLNFLRRYQSELSMEKARFMLSRRLPVYRAIPYEMVDRALQDKDFYLVLSKAETGAFTATVLDSIHSFGYDSGSILDPTVADPFGMIALHIAAGNTTSEACRQLIAHGVSPNVQDSLGVAPLLDAVFFGHEIAVDMLLNVGADTHLSLRKTTTRFENIHTIDSGFDALKNRHEFLGDEWRQTRDFAFKLFSHLEWSLLHIAVWHGSLAIIELLLAHGIEPRHKDLHGRTTIELAIVWKGQLSHQHYSNTKIV